MLSFQSIGTKKGRKNINIGLPVSLSITARDFCRVLHAVGSALIWAFRRSKPVGSVDWRPKLLCGAVSSFIMLTDDIIGWRNEVSTIMRLCEGNEIGGLQVLAQSRNSRCRLTFPFTDSVHDSTYRCATRSPPLPTVQWLSLPSLSLSL